MPKVSVIIPAYNAENYIEECLASVVAQTLADIEIIVVDDGSTDQTRSLVAKAAKEDSRISLIEQENQYAGVARNNGMERAVGDYLYFLDADDYIEPDALELMTSSAEKFGTDIVIARSEAFDMHTGNTWPIDFALNGQPYNSAICNSSYDSTLFQSFNGWPWDKLYKTSFVEKTGYKFQALRTSNDAFFCWCTLAAAKSVSCIDKALFHHRSNNTSSLEGSRNKSWRCAIESIESVSNELQRLGVSEACMNSFHNWVLNYSIWTIDTLPDVSAQAYLDSISPFIRAFNKKAPYPPLRNHILLHLIEGAEAIDIRNDIREIDSICQSIPQLEEELKQTRNELSRIRDELVQARSTIQGLEIDKENLYQSHSYRLGNSLLKPLSLIKASRKRDK